LPSPTGRGEQVAENQRVQEIKECRIGNRMAGKPENVRERQSDPLSPWERARERVSKPQACLFGKRYNPVHPINPYPKASSCRIKPNHE